MNYYEHHIGDYAQATAHLTFIEDAAYCRLIRKYYAEEKPLPADIKAVQRLVGARTQAERQAVATVLSEFFVLEADGWHNKRCDEEISKYRLKQDKARASAAARWAKREADAMRTQCERNANAMRTQCSPDTRHQTPNHTAAAAHTSVEVWPSAAAADPIHSRAIELTVLLRQRGAALQPSDPRVRAWAEAGISDAQALAAMETAQQRRHEQANPQPINAGYLDAIIKATTTPAAQQPQQPNRRRSIHDERADTIAALTGRIRPEAQGRIIDITTAAAYRVG